MDIDDKMDIQNDRNLTNINNSEIINNILYKWLINKNNSCRHDIFFTLYFFDF